MAERNQDAVGPGGEIEVKTNDKSATLPPSTPASLRQLAEEQLSERDDVESAYKEAMTATDHGKEAKAKVKAVDASRDAGDTPSGHALKKAAGESNDTKRGEKYAAEKTRKRWGYEYVE